MKILVVDNDEGVLSVITESLQAQELTLIIRHSVSEAKRYLGSDSGVAMVICDTALQSESERDLLDYVKSNLRFKHIPVLVCSSFLFSNSIKQAIKRGARDILAKPINPETLKQKVAKIIATGRGSILIVDDDGFTLDILQVILKREGYITHPVKSSEVAMEKLMSTKIDAVIANTTLAGVSGFDFLAQVKTNYPNIPVLMITGFSGKSSSESIIAQGADGQIEKPFKNTQIVDAIRAVI